MEVIPPYYEVVAWDEWGKKPPADANEPPATGAEYPQCSVGINYVEQGISRKWLVLRQGMLSDEALHLRDKLRGLLPDTVTRPLPGILFL